MRLGSYDAILTPNTKVWHLYKEFNQMDLEHNLVKERHRHRFEVNPKFHEILSIFLMLLLKFIQSIVHLVGSGFLDQI